MPKMSGSSEDLTTALVRNRNMVHYRTCYQVRGRFVNPWYWAEGKTRAEVAESSRNGLGFCSSCRPLDHLSADHGDV